MKKRILSLILVAAMAIGMTACAPKLEDVVPTTAPTTAPVQNDQSGTENTENKNTETTQPEATATPVPAKELVYAEGTTLRMAVGYNNNKTGISFIADIAKDGITLADGKTYNTGDLKPTWVEVQNRLGIAFEDKYQGNNSTKEYEYWQEKMGEIDVINVALSKVNAAGEAGQFVDLAQYLDYMPNFKAYLEKNSIVRLSITGNTNTGAIYFAPYFDGVNDIERMPLMRTDWVEKLLNGEGAFTASASKNLNAAVYTPYMPTSGKIAVDVVKNDVSGVETINKDYDAAGNIVKTMNDALAAGTVTGVDAVNMLRDYIDKAYNGYYGTNRADLFIGQNAAWDADELVALLRCVVANPQTLNGTDAVQGLFSREDDNNQRRVDMYRFMGTLFGVRGMESRQDFLYIGTDGKLHDARSEADTYVAVERMNAMAQEGLMSSSFMNKEDTDTGVMLQTDAGFMHYDYNQTQTIYNETKLNEGEKYMAVMVPVARWNDGAEKYMRFTESWRSVKDSGWAVSVAGINGDENKLNAALKLLDYAYSPEGIILMSYGPDAFIKTNADGSYVTFNFNGEPMPVIADATYAELWEKASGNYTNYARQYLGSTLAFAKSQAFEYQCTHEVGREGAGKISNAIGLGTIKHPENAITENPWYTNVPAALPSTTQESETIANYAQLGETFSPTKGKENLFLQIIVSGYAANGYTDAASVINAVKADLGGEAVLNVKNLQWNKLTTYYDKIK